MGPDGPGAPALCLPRAQPQIQAQVTGAAPPRCPQAAPPRKGALGQPEALWDQGGLTLSTNVLSFSGISKGMVVRTSTTADRGMLTLGLEA